jgi:hypothetical protein
MGNITEVTEPLLIYTLSADRPNNESKRSFDGQRVRENRERYIALHRGIGYFHQDVADPYTRLLAWQKVKVDDEFSLIRRIMLKSRMGTSGSGYSILTRLS